MSLVVKYSESPVKLMENQKLVEIQFPNTATEIIGLKTDNLTKIDVSKCSKDFVSTVKSNYQDKFNNKGENVQVINPNMVIEYTASEKLTETTNYYDDGIKIGNLRVTIISHTFENGKGKIVFNEEITNISNAFSSNQKMTSISLPESVTYIDGNAFQSCGNLTSISVPNSVTSIGRNAFQYCYALTSITLPDKVNRIDASAFSSCNKLNSITCNPVTPPTLGSSAIPSNVTTIYVPSGSVDAYKTATNWSSFASKITAIV